MPKVAPAQTSFTGGEFSPLLYGRVDSDRYKTALATCLNYIPTLQGPIIRRPGTKYVAEVKSSSVKTRLIPFEFSVTQAYILEFGNQHFRVYKDNAQIAGPVEVATPYVEADLFALKFVQSADTLYVVHPSYAPRKITRTSHTSWSISTITFLDGPYLPTNTTATTITPSAATGAGITLTASSSIFAATDIGRVVRMREGSVWGYARISAYTSGTQVTADVVNTLTNVNPKSTWRLGVWSATTGYPAAVTFHEDRLCFGGPTSYPQRVDLSNSADYENFAPSATDGSVAATHAIGLTLNSKDVQVVRWLASDEKGLLAGTVKAEWVIRPSTTGEALSPTNIKAGQSTSYGSANIQPVQSGKATMMVQRAGRKVRELSWVFEADGFRGPDITALSEHVTTSGITQMDLQQEPWNILWAVRTDGVLIGLTYDRDVDNLKAGWHRHILGGVFGTGNAVVESVAVIPAPAGDRDEVWLVVKRTIGGSTKRYIEYMVGPFEDDDAQEDAYFVDCGGTYDGAPATTISGLSHLNGQTVQVLADGAVRPDEVVSGGQIVLDSSASVVQVGLAYDSDGKCLRIEGGSGDGAALSKTRRINHIAFLLHRSLNLLVGSNFNEADEVGGLVRWIFRDAGDDMGVAVPLFSGIKDDAFNGDYDKDGYVCWRQDQPLPSTILAVIPNQGTYDRG